MDQAKNLKIFENKLQSAVDKSKDILTSLISLEELKTLKELKELKELKTRL